MLVLRRSCGQSFVIGKNAEIVVKVLNEDKGVISIGIDAPKDIQIDRLEIFEKRQNSSHEFISNHSQVNSVPEFQ